MSLLGFDAIGRLALGQVTRPGSGVKPDDAGRTYEAWQGGVGHFLEELMNLKRADVVERRPGRALDRRTRQRPQFGGSPAAAAPGGMTAQSLLSMSSQDFETWARENPAQALAMFGGR